MLAASPTSAQSDALTGDRLLELCEGAAAVSEAGAFAGGAMCAGYIRGAFDMQTLILEGDRGIRLCPPVDMTNTDLVRTVTDGIRARPELRRSSARVAIYAVVLAAFRCPSVP